MSRRESFERILKQRSTRRSAVSTGLLAGLGGVVGLSLPGSPTRSYARQGTPELVATPSDPPLTRRASATFGAYPFQLGVASGDPDDHSVVLWTRLAPSPIDGGGMDPVPYELAWEVASDDSFSSIVQNGTAVADPNLAHSVHVDVTGLDAATEYFYRFMVGDEVSDTGRTKTAPAQGEASELIRLGFVSCSNYEHGYFAGYRDLATRDLDLVLHLGDYIYEYAANDYNVREPENFRQVPDGETYALRDYRNRYAIYHTDPDLRMVRASAPMSVTWDDHEVDNNYANLVSEENDPLEAFRQRRADAYQAYYEHMPLRASSLPVGEDMTLYRSLDYGDLLNIQILDTRQYRTDHPAGDGEYPRSPASTDPATSLLGAPQERWLLQNLERSEARWNVLAQQVTMAETYFPPSDGGAIEFYNDSWSGYPAARQRLLDHFVSAQVSNPVVLTGDIHSSWAADLITNFLDPESPIVGSEYVCTSITAGGTAVDTWGQAYKDAFEYIKLYDGRHGGFTTVDVTNDLWKADYFVVDNMEDPESGVSHLTTLVTENGEPGVQPS